MMTVKVASMSVMVFLVSEQARWITRETLIVHGGAALRRAERGRFGDR